MLVCNKAIRRLTARRSSSLISSQRLTSSKVRRQLRQTSSPSTVVQWPTQGESAVISAGTSREAGMGRHYTGCVARSSCVNQFIACSRDVPHISAEGCNPPQKAGRCGWPNTLQRSSSSSWVHGIPAGLPCGMPGRGEVMEGAMQQAAQWGRHDIFSLSALFFEYVVSVITEKMFMGAQIFSCGQ